MREQLILIYSYLHGIWQYRWTALVISGLLAITGWAVVYALPNQYTAQAVVHVDTASVMKPLLEGLAVESDADTGINIVSRLLLSRKNLEDVIRQTDLGIEADSPEAMDKLVYKLGRSIELKLGSKDKRKGDNSIYELSYQGISAELAYRVVSKLLNTLIENTLDSTRTDTAAAQQFLDRQITEYENRLTAAEQKLADFKRANVGFMPDEKGDYYRRLQSEESKLDAIKSELQLAKRRHSAMLKQLEGEAPLLDSNSYGGQKILKLRKYREQLEQLLTQYKEQHPDVKALRATIAEIMAEDNITEDEFIDAGSGDSIEFNPVYQELKAEINKASVEVETLKVQLYEQKSSVQALKQAVDILPGVEAELAKLNRDYEITRERYLDFVMRRESARLAQAVGQSGSSVKFRIIEPPRVPTKPSGPNRMLLLTAVFLASIAVGLGWGFLRYLIHPTFIDTSQIRDKIGLPILGSVGLYLSDQHKRKRRLQLVSFMVVFFLLVISYGAAMVFSEPGSELVNAYITSRSWLI